MKISDAERAIRHYATEWFRTLPEGGQEHPSFIDFKAWLHANGHGAVLQFRSVMGADADAERWFDDELGQGWRR